MAETASHTCAPAFAHSSGPRKAKIAIVGEAWGADEERIGGVPFVGYSGQELTRLLQEVEIERSQCFLTNVLALRPPNNNVEALCSTKTMVGPGYPYTPIKAGKYLRREYLGEVARLKEELGHVAPNMVIALGNTAAWALLGTGGISSIRGTVAESSLLPGLKILPTYHPAAILRQWNWRPILSADLLKAKAEAEFPEVRRPQRKVLISPTFPEIEDFYQRYVAGAIDMAVDIETKRSQITCIGFAPSPVRAIVIPFWDPAKAGASFWPTMAEEILAWKWVQRFLASQAKKIFQNGLYDLQYILKMGLVPRNVAEDTMLLHHALYPEMQKGLGFLASIYSTENSSWKLMNKRRTDEVVKRDE